MSSSSAYTPANSYLQKYAQVLVNFALNSGLGIEKNQTVMCVVPDVAKPLALHLQNEVLKAGGHPIIRLIPSNFEKDFFKYASANQITYYPEDYYSAQAELVDHTIAILADVNPTELVGTPPEKIMAARNSKKPYRDLLVAKELSRAYTWTVALWGVEAKAKIVGLSLKDYWKQIIKACFLDSADPISEWKFLFQFQKNIRENLNQLRIDSLKIDGPDVNLKLKIGENRIWQGGSGRNIPSFELFTSPDWRGTEGWIRFNQPVYRYGGVIEDAILRFEKGLVVEAKAIKGEKLLREMLKTENANKIGEFSLTDRRMSRITHPMAETLYDENIGGRYGNTHLAIGMSYRDCYRGNPANVSKKDWESMGYNDSAEHTDLISTSKRKVIAHLTNGSSQLIYDQGEFKI